MALTLTTLVGAVPVDQASITVASATGATVGGFVLIDQEIMQIQKGYPYAGVPVTTIPVLRGLEGSLTQVHPTGAQVKFYLGSDTTTLPGQQDMPLVITSPARQRVSYSASGALTLPLPGNDMDAVLNGTTVRAMTLANPTTDMDGCRLVVMGNGIAAHTITYTAGFGNVGGTADLITFGTTQAQSVQFVACGGFWLLLGPTGATAVAANVSGPLVA